MTKESERKQRELIRSFDRELFTYTGQVVWVLPGLFAFLGGISYMIPMEESQMNGMRLMSIMYGACAACFLMQPYLTMPYQHQPVEKRQTIYQVFRYLPVSRKQLRLVRIGYLWSFFWKYSLAMVVIRMVFSCIFGEFRLVSILFAIFSSFAIPMLVGILNILTLTKK